MSVTFQFLFKWRKLPNIVKQANLTPASRKGNRSSKVNYRPVSILPVIAKIFEKLLGKQVTNFVYGWIFFFNVTMILGRVLVTSIAR